MLKGAEALTLALSACRLQAVYAAPDMPLGRVLRLLERQDAEGLRPRWCLSAAAALGLGLGGALLSEHPTAVLLGSPGLCGATAALQVSGVFGAYRSGAVLFEGVAPEHPAGAPDSRPAMALLSHLPVLEPGSADEIYHMTRLAYRLSGAAGLPVLVRLSRRALADRADIRLPAEKAAPLGTPVFHRDEGPYVTSPLLQPFHAQTRQRRLQALGQVAGALTSRSAVGGAGKRGVILAGHLGLRPQLRAASRGLSTLRLGMAWPLPEAALLRFLGSVSEALVLEEGEPFLLTQIQALAHRAGVSARIFGPERRSASELSDADVDAALQGLQGSAAGAMDGGPSAFQWDEAQGWVEEGLVLRLDDQGEATEEPWALHFARRRSAHGALLAGDVRAHLLGQVRAVGLPSIVAAGAGPAAVLSGRRLVDVRLHSGGAAALAGGMALVQRVMGAEEPAGPPLLVALVEDLGEGAGELLGMLDNAQQRRSVLHLVLRRGGSGGLPEDGAALEGDSAASWRGGVSALPWPTGGDTLAQQLRAAGMEVVSVDAADEAGVARALAYLAHRVGPRALLCELQS